MERMRTGSAKPAVTPIGRTERIQTNEHRQPAATCGSTRRRRPLKLIRRTVRVWSLAVRYFSDPEDAKTWLVSERFPDNPLQSPY